MFNSATLVDPLFSTAVQLLGVAPPGEKVPQGEKVPPGEMAGTGKVEGKKGEGEQGEGEQEGGEREGEDGAAKAAKTAKTTKTTKTKKKFLLCHIPRVGVSHEDIGVAAVRHGLSCHTVPLRSFVRVIGYIYVNRL